ncbi:UV radiation resistance protein and autophagy-related subunit 14-domain-containing protein [Ephemerocybe angulata]|uniref:Autophagy-related protein 14 n=1 Tax=Ephemerocybe angulata TaxID=980116 RepID=A0A8H6M4N3_9AGAR|nr:UV radiation resistance protein and autophagy-related subunit 14-domain-containing protein [Tulosesus angulatus]
MECRNCELRQRQFYCRTCIKTHLRDFQSQHGHYSTDLSSVVSSASVALTNTVQPARSARARVAEVRGRIDEAVAGLGGIKRECDKKRDRIRKLREDLAQRRRTLGAARILPDTSGPPHLPPSPAHLALTQTLARARSGLVQELVDVFHIVEVGGRPPVGGKAGTKGEWTIGGLVLPVPGDIRRYPPDHINAVLTLTIHFLSLLSFYLGIKLPFAVSWTGGKLGLGQPWIGAIRGGSAGGGDGGWGRWHKKHPTALDESAFLVRSPLTPTPTSPPPPRTTHTSSHRKPPDAPSNTQTQTHLTPSTAPPSFTTGYTMLIYNVCYLAHTQRVAPEIGLSQAGEVLSNLWRCCCSAELGRVGHESGGGGALTLVRLPPPTPPTFAMDFGQLLQAVSGAGGAGARAKTKMARRKGYSETMPGGVVEEEGLEEEGYENLNGESVMRDLRGGTQAQRTGTGTGSKDRDRDGVDPFKDDWDLVDEDVSF